jgi:hypothetical protein
VLNISVFRAIDDLESCQKFAEGHANVLKDYGVTKVTSAKTDWFYNPGAFVVLVEDEKGNVVGGERIHTNHKDFELPIESAIKIVEKGIHALVAQYSDNKITGELCGLWNAKAIAGKGVSVLLTKMGVAMARMLGMDSLFVLCAPYTVQMCKNAGFEVETSIGNQGEFVYPKLDLIATSLVVKDMKNIATADEGFKREISYFYEHPESEYKILHGENEETKIVYNISLPNIRHEYNL